MAPVKNNKAIMAWIMKRASPLVKRYPNRMGLSIPPNLPKVPAMAKQRDLQRIGNDSGTCTYLNKNSSITTQNSMRYTYRIVQMLTIQKYKAQNDTKNIRVLVTIKMTKLSTEAAPKLIVNKPRFIL